MPFWLASARNGYASRKFYASRRCSESLPVLQDVQRAGDHVSNVLPLARKYGLSAYDAAYLELSIRHGAPLATLDGRLVKAAKQAGVKIFEGAAQ